MIYKLTIECASKEIAKNIQAWADRCFHSDEIFWNAITEIEDEDYYEEDALGGDWQG